MENFSNIVTSNQSTMQAESEFRCGCRILNATGSNTTQMETNTSATGGMAAAECLGMITSSGSYTTGDFVFDTLLVFIAVGTATAALVVVLRARAFLRLLVDKFILLEMIISLPLACVFYSHLLRYMLTAEQPRCQDDFGCRTLAWLLISIAGMRGTVVVMITLIRLLSVVSPFFYERHLAFTNRSPLMCLLFFAITIMSFGVVYLNPSLSKMHISSGLCIPALRLRQNYAHWLVVGSFGFIVFAVILIFDVCMLVYSRRLLRNTPTVAWDTTMAEVRSRSVNAENDCRRCAVLSDIAPNTLRRSTSEDNVCYRLLVNRSCGDGNSTPVSSDDCLDSLAPKTPRRSTSEDNLCHRLDDKSLMLVNRSRSDINSMPSVGSDDCFDYLAPKTLRRSTSEDNLCHRLDDESHMLLNRSRSDGNGMPSVSSDGCVDYLAPETQHRSMSDDGLRYCLGDKSCELLHRSLCEDVPRLNNELISELEHVDDLTSNSRVSEMIDSIPTHRCCRSVNCGICQKRHIKASRMRRYSAITREKFKLVRERITVSPITKLIMITSTIHVLSNLPFFVSIDRSATLA